MKNKKKKYLKLSSAAVVIGTLKLKRLFSKPLYLFIYFIFNKFVHFCLSLVKRITSLVQCKEVNDLFSEFIC